MALMSERKTSAHLNQLVKNSCFIAGPPLLHEDSVNNHYRQKSPTRRSSISVIVTDVVKQIKSSQGYGKKNVEPFPRKFSLQDSYVDTYKQSTLDSNVSSPFRRSSCADRFSNGYKDPIRTFRNNNDSIKRLRAYPESEKGLSSNVEEVEVSYAKIQTNKEPQYHLNSCQPTKTEKVTKNKPHKSSRKSSTKNRKKLSKCTQPSIESFVQKAIASREHDSLARLLSLNNEASYNINFMFPTGGTALHQAIIMGDSKSVELLVDAGADIRMKTLQGHSPTLLAAQCGHFEIAQFLLLRGADVEDVENGHQ